MVVLGESWDLELRLSLGRSTDGSPAESCTPVSGMDESFGDSSHNPHQNHHQQQQQQKQKTRVTMFYNGQISVCDVTELQAKAILSMARTETLDDAMSKNNARHQQQHRQRLVQSSPPAPATAPPPPQPMQRLRQPAGLSMKRSLQRFLEKRNSRIGAVDSHAHRKQQLLLFPNGI